MVVAITRRELGAGELRREAARCRDARAARRMLALALVLEGGSRETAARAAGMDRQSLRDWVHRYNAEGLAGLRDRRRPGRRPRLTPAQEAELAAVVEQGPDPDRDGVVRKIVLSPMSVEEAVGYGAALAGEDAGGLGGEVPAAGEQLGRRPVGDDAPVGHEDRPLGEGGGELGVVRGDDHRRARRGARAEVVGYAVGGAGDGGWVGLLGSDEQAHAGKGTTDAGVAHEGRERHREDEADECGAHPGEQAPGDRAGDDG